MRLRCFSSLMLLLPVAFAVACARDSARPPVSPTTDQPTAVVVRPVGLDIDGPAALPAGHSVRYAALVELSDGSSRPAVDPLWSSSNEHVAIVDAGGLVTGRNAGAFDLRVRAEGHAARLASVKVLPAPKAWSISGIGPRLFDVPERVTRVRVRASYGGRHRHFVLWCGSPDARGSLLADVYLGTAPQAVGTRYDEEHSARRVYGPSTLSCGQFHVEYGDGVRWTVSEIAPLGY